MSPMHVTLKAGVIKRVANFWSSHKSQKIADCGIIRLDCFRKWAANPSHFFGGYPPPLGTAHCSICDDRVTNSIGLSGFLFVYLFPVPPPLAFSVCCFASVLCLLQNTTHILPLIIIFVCFFSPFSTYS